MTIVNLDEVSKDGAVTHGGTTHVVKPMSAKMLTVMRSDMDNLEKMLTVIGNRVPTLSRETLEDMSLAQLEAILDVSMGSVKTVEQAAPNGVSETAAQPSPNTQG